MKRFKKKDFQPAKEIKKVTPGQALASLRKLQGLTQSQLAKKTGISQANLSSMERGRQQIGRERAMLLAKALKVHPAVIMFPNYQVDIKAA